VSKVTFVKILVLALNLSMATVMLVDLNVMIGIQSSVKVVLLIFFTYCLGRNFPRIRKLSKIIDIPQPVLHLVLGINVGALFILIPKWSFQILLLAALSGLFNLLKSQFQMSRVKFQEYSKRRLVSFAEIFWNIPTLLAILVGLVGVRVCQNAAPILFEGHWKYHEDVAIMESYANSLNINGLSRSILSDSGQMKYHWIVYGFTSLINDFAQLPPFVFLNWIWPLIVLALIVALFITTKSLNQRNNSWGLFLLLAGVGFEIGSWVNFSSPTTLGAIPIVIICSAIFVKSYEAHVLSMELVLYLFLFVFFLTGTKGSTAVVFTASVIIFHALQHWIKGKNKNFSKSRDIVVFAIFMSFTLGYFFFFNQREIFPLNLGISLNSISLIPLVIMSLLTFKFSAGSFAQSYFYAILFVGVCLAIFTRHNSGNELFFLIASIQISYYLAMAFGNVEFPSQLFVSSWEKTKSKVIGISSVSIIAIFFTLLWKAAEHLKDVAGKVSRSLIELSIPAAFICSTLLISWISKQVILKKLEQLIRILIHVPAIIGCLSLTTNLMMGPTSSNGKQLDATQGGISRDYFRAGEWVRLNLDPSVQFITNRYCVIPASTPPDCLDTWAIASTLTSRNFLFDGGAYVHQSWGLVEKSVQRSLYTKEDLLGYEFMTTPTAQEFKKLIDRGVNWVWLDKNSEFSPDVFCFVQERFGTKEVSILYLLDQRKKVC
jgi:hypothetical protein